MSTAYTRKGSIRGWAGLGKAITRTAALIVAFLYLAAPAGAQTGTVIPSPIFTGFDNSGVVISGGKLCSYTAGTSTPANTYTSVTLVTPNSNPVILDSAGRATIFLTPGQSYKFVLRTAGTDATCATGSVLWTVDNVGAVPSSSSALDVLGTAGEAITAGQVVYLSDGSGSKNAGQWYKADATLPYASTSALTGIAPNAIASGVAGSIRRGGQATGLSGLVLGSYYYVSTTAGSLTATAPAARRLIGFADSTSTLILAPDLPTPALPIFSLGLDDFRVSALTATCASSTDVTAATTIYLTPCLGNRITLYDSSGNPTVYTTAEISIAVPATTATMYDVFVYVTSGGVPALELLAWTNVTTRATAVVKTVAVGVWTKSGDATRRYVGSFCTTGVSGQTEDSLAKRLVWNTYNRVRSQVKVSEATASWGYNSTTWRQARAQTTNQIAVVQGLAEETLDLGVWGMATNDAGGTAAATGIAEDAAVSPVANTTVMILANIDADASPAMVVRLTKIPAVGYHYYPWMEISSATGNTTFYGGGSSYGGASLKSGLDGTWMR